MEWWGRMVLMTGQSELEEKYIYNSLIYSMCKRWKDPENEGYSHGSYDRESFRFSRRKSISFHFTDANQEHDTRVNRICSTTIQNKISRWIFEIKIAWQLLEPDFGRRRRRGSCRRGWVGHHAWAVQLQRQCWPQSDTTHCGLHLESLHEAGNVLFPPPILFSCYDQLKKMRQWPHVHATERIV